jgi:hypothetical protein
LDRAAWRFYSGDNDWSTDWRLSKVVLDRHPPLNVHWNEYLGKYLIATTFLSHRIGIAMADTPSGPWAADSLTIEGLLPIAGFPWIESPVAHPEWTRHRGRIEMLTYTRSVGWLQNEMRVVEVEFRKQDASVPGRGRLPLP